MKKIKNLLCPLLAATMMIGMTMTVAAADREVVFDGKEISSTMEASENISGMTPGDEVTLDITLKNTGSAQTDWYIKNDLAHALAAGAESTGGSFEYELTYDGTTVFSNSTIIDERMETATAVMNDYMFLGTMNANDSKTVSLRIYIDGETQGNAYQSSLTRLNMIFAATSGEGQTVVVEPEPTPTPEPEKTPNPAPVTTATVQTGDTFNMQLFTIIFVVSGILVLALAVYSFYRDHRKEA